MDFDMLTDPLMDLSAYQSPLYSLISRAIIKCDMLLLIINCLKNLAVLTLQS